MINLFNRIFKINIAMSKIINNKIINTRLLG